MGYVPPVRDEQVLIYGNRHQSAAPMINRVAEVQRAQLSKTLKYPLGSRDYFERQHQNARKNKQVQHYERSLTGKGKRFDQSV